MEELFGKIKELNKNPLVATFYMTTRCNLRCNYCYELDRATVEDLSSERIVRVLEGLSAHDIHMEALFLFGGEPTLCADNCLFLLTQLKQMKQNNNIRKVLFTNGMVIPDRLLTLITDNELDVFLSSDGFGEAAKERYGVYFADKQSVFLRNLKRMQPETSRITISAAVGKHNIQTIVNDMDLFFRNYHIRSFKINIIRKNCFAASYDQLSKERQKALVWAGQNEIELMWDPPAAFGSQYDNLYISQERISFQPAGLLGTWSNVSW
ncbi:MAG: radical SAM protein [Oscillospiraceae bacterium]|jgi:sulfatase maturation enzyme AslB (radical SAM superfamily)